MPAAARTALKWAAGVVLVIANLAAIAHQSLVRQRGHLTFDRYRIDLDVYRIGSTVWRHAGDLYGPMRATRVGLALPFTYPPIAAVALAPLTLVPFAVASGALTVASIAMLAVVAAVFLRALGVPRRLLLWSVAVLLPLGLFLEPVQANLSFGQVNIILMLLVTLDCLIARPRWPRGALVGVAAAIKLTPAVFVIFFLVRRDYRAARNALLSFVATTGIGFLLSWHSSVEYWTGTVFDSGRIGGVGYVGNQSLQAVLARVGLHGSVATLGWIVLSIGVVALVVLGMSRAVAAGQFAPALVLNAFCVLLVSPISWTHHWVWIAPALLCLLALAWRARLWTPLLLAAAGVALFTIGPQWHLPQGGDRELAWSWGQQIIGGCYLWYAVVVLGYAAFSRALWRDARPPGRQAGESVPSVPSVRSKKASRASA